MPVVAFGSVDEDANPTQLDRTDVADIVASVPRTDVSGIDVSGLTGISREDLTLLAPIDFTALDLGSLGNSAISDLEELARDLLSGGSTADLEALLGN